ncbi:pleckstrin-likey domain-containing family A member 5 isoform X19 [Silurus asotus]|uniref:Pleckstrin-likey domain-containing family A member 5 isoform X19 n=1 Tax=Silurus asotus TaxID=30991 RepID=A0AAD5AJH1_SILAS|nr:pleckstrin-likey domain-containing family A member 5 isoform X19 [Silurus asotus]
MAADLNPDWISCLPSSWSYGVIRDGRVFFINEEAKSTTWLHPVTGEAVITGHRKTPDLPTGWEEGYTFEGARCFINCVVSWTAVLSAGVENKSCSDSVPMCRCGEYAENYMPGFSAVGLHSTSSSHAAPEHDAATTMLDCQKDTIFLVLLTRTSPHMLDII